MRLSYIDVPLGDIAEQILIEDRYHRGHFWELFEGETADLMQEATELLAKALVEYANKEHEYAAKTARYQLLKAFVQPEELAAATVRAALLYQTMAPAHGLMNSIVNAIPDELTLEASVKISLDIIMLCGEIGLLTGQLPRDAESGSLSLKCLIELDADTCATVDALMYPLPLIVPPDILECNTDSPYLTMKRDHVILGGKAKQHSGSVNLDLLNRLNHQLLRIVPSKVPCSLEDLPTQERLVAAMKILGRDEVYLTWKFDMRGRVYSQGYHCNFQGKDLQKAAFRLPEPISL